MAICRACYRCELWPLYNRDQQLVLALTTQSSHQLYLVRLARRAPRRPGLPPVRRLHGSLRRAVPPLLREDRAFLSRAPRAISYTGVSLRTVLLSSYYQHYIHNHA